MKSLGGRGLTLIELLISTTLVGLVAISAGALYGTSSRYLVQETNSVRAQNELSHAVEHIRRRMINCTAIPEPPNGAPAAQQMNVRGDPGDGLGNREQRYFVAEPVGGVYELRYFPNWTGEPARFEVLLRNALGADPGDPPSFTRVSNNSIRLVLGTREGTGSNERRMRVDTLISSRGISPGG